MSTQENAAPVATPEAAPKPPSKMEKARVLLNSLKAEGAVIPEGSSIRKEFIAKAILDINLTRNGAITYYNNLNNEAKGKPLYIKPAAKAKTPTVGTVGDAESQVTKTEESIAGDKAADAALTGLADDVPPADESLLDSDEEEQKDGE